MATNKERLQVRLAPALMEEVRQLQASLSMTDSAVGAMLIAIGMKQCRELGLIDPEAKGAAGSSSTTLAPRRKERAKQPEVSKEEAPLGFRPKGEYEKEQPDGALVAWVPSRGYMAGL